MLQLTHIKITNETLKKMGLYDHINEKVILGSVFPDSSILGFFRWDCSFDSDRVHKDKKAIGYFLEEGELHFAIGVLTHQIADEMFHGEAVSNKELNGYAFQKADQLLPSIKERYNVDRKTQRWFGHILVEKAIEELVIYPNGKPEETGLLENAVKHYSDELIVKVSKYYKISQKNLLELNEIIKRLDLGFFENVESSRKIFAYYLQRKLSENKEEYKNPTKKNLGSRITSYIFGCNPNPIIWGITHLPQRKAKEMTYLFDEAKKLVQIDYLMFLEKIKENIEKGISPYLERIKNY